MQASNEYVDFEDALNRIGGNETLYKKLLGYFLNENHLEPLCDAVANGDYVSGSQLAHTIKGTCANLSLKKIKTLSAEIESGLKSGLDCTELIDELKSAYVITKNYIDEYIS